MKIKTAMILVFAVLVSKNIFCGDGGLCAPSEEKVQGQKELVVANAPPAEDTAKTSSSKKSKTDEGFTSAPRTVIYGPLGIVLKVLEFTLEKLYIIYED
jgi:hypothetical protein